MFERSKKSLKEFGLRGILAIISYLFLNVFVGFALSRIESFGSLGYVVSLIGFLCVFSAIKLISGTEILEAFTQDWRDAPIKFHFLIIFNVLIWATFLHLSNKPELNHKLLCLIKKNFGK